MYYTPSSGAPTIIGGCTITSVGTLATVTTPTAHGRSTGQAINIRMATDAAFNVAFKTITVTSTTTFTFVMDSVPAVSTAVALEALVVLGSYLSVAPSTRTSGAGGAIEPVGRGITWGDYTIQMLFPYFMPERVGVIPYRQQVSLASAALGTINAGASFTSANQTLTGISTKIRGSAFAISGTTAGLELTAVPTASTNTYAIVARNITASNITPGDSVFEVEFNDTRPWSSTDTVR
jgi:hypothetical protein